MLSSITREFAALLVFYRIKGLKDGFDLDYRIYIYSAHCHLFATLTTRQATALKPCDIVKKNAASAQSSLYICTLKIIYCLPSLEIKTFLHFFIYQWRRGSRCCCSRPADQRWRCSDPAAQSPPRSRYHSPATQNSWYNRWQHTVYVHIKYVPFLLQQDCTINGRFTLKLAETS